MDLIAKPRGLFLAQLYRAACAGLFDRHPLYETKVGQHVSKRSKGAADLISVSILPPYWANERVGLPCSGVLKVNFEAAYQMSGGFLPKTTRSTMIVLAREVLPKTPVQVKS